MRTLDNDKRAADAYAASQGAKAFGQLAKSAANLGVAVDIMATALSAVNVPQLSEVARTSGGAFMLHTGKCAAVT